MSYLKLWLVRHGETTVNTGTWSDAPQTARLTLKGLAQAEQSAAQVLEEPDHFLVSPLIRAQETSQFFINKWPDTPVTCAPIQEFVYLSPKRLSQLEPKEIKAEVDKYWHTCDPYFCDGEDTESFAQFLQRISDFYQELVGMQGYVVAIGHGQFFKAFQMSFTHGFIPSPQWMSIFRQQESANPIMNGQIIKLFYDEQKIRKN